MPTELKLDWRTIRTAVYSILVTYVFGVFVLGWVAPQPIAGFMGLVAALAVFLIAWEFFSKKRA